MIYHHLQQLEEVWSQEMVLLEEDDMSSEILCYSEVVEDICQFPPPVVFCLAVFSFSIMAVYVWPPGVGAVSARISEYRGKGEIINFSNDSSLHLEGLQSLAQSDGECPGKVSGFVWREWG